MLKLIVFTKYLKGLDIERLIEVIKFVDGEGADLCVRPGYLVEPENCSENLPEIVKNFKDAGLSIPLITTPVDFVEPDSPITEKLFSTCGEIGIKLIKLGYWFMGKDYWETVGKIRKIIEKFVKLSEKYNVKVLIHTHSGETMSINSASTMNLIKGFDPRYIGVFLDPGHLSLVGEPLPMALNIVGEYLSAVAVKDFVRERVISGGKRTWEKRVVPLGEGFADWHTLIRLLLEMKFSGPVSIHSEYSEYDLETIIDQTRIDIRYFRKVISIVQQEMAKGSTNK